MKITALIGCAALMLAMHTSGLADTGHLDPLNACMKAATTQFAMDVCASDDAKRMDGDMATMYEKLLVRAARIPNASSLVKKTQGAWLAYRKAYMAAGFPLDPKQENYGSSYPMQADLWYADITRKHVGELRALYDALGKCGHWGPRC